LENFTHLFEFSVSYTTRQPRAGEVDGVHYNFVSKDDFEIDIKAGNFIEYAQFADNYYGTNK
jgi:guanylate kinase